MIHCVRLFPIIPINEIVGLSPIKPINEIVGAKCVQIEELIVENKS